MTPEQALTLTPGQIVYFGHLSIDAEYPPLFVASIQVADVVAHQPGRDGESGKVTVDIHPWGIGDKNRRNVDSSDIFLTRSAAIENVQQEFCEHLEECDRFAVEMNGMLVDALKEEVIQ